jgi:hypothetical protein
MQCEQHFRRSWFAVPPCRRALSLRRHGTTRSASRAAISALAAAIAVFRATSSARRWRPGDWLIAMPILISEPTPNCSLTAAANPEGDSDAHAGFGGFCNRDGVRGWPSNGPNVRPRLSRLPARVWTRHLLRMSLYIVTSVQCVGIGPRGTMRAQSICRERGRVGGTTLPATPPGLLIYSERTWSLVTYGARVKRVSPQSITTIGSMDSGSVPRGASSDVQLHIGNDNI